MPPSAMLAKRATLALMLSVFVLIAGCSAVGEDAPKSGSVDITGTVNFIELEGGHWVIAEDGETYDPLNLPQDFRVEGLSVQVTGEIRKDVVSICMCGPIIEIKDIKRR